VVVVFVFVEGEGCCKSELFRDGFYSKLDSALDPSVGLSMSCGATDCGSGSDKVGAKKVGVRG
jgi:hypothetical protein